MENLHISAGTVARTLILILAIVNQILSACGKSPLPIESETLEQLVTAGFTTVAALIAWWKNNSFTTNALKADALLTQLNGKH
jgi:SPP1 family holin|nr:MAG TPA: holin [Caudoviricetes sp.]